MKTKLILLACISIAFASCKKDETQLAQPQTPTVSIEKQVADLIQKTDKNLYDEVYNQHALRAETVDVKVTKGAFRIPIIDGQPSPESGTCMTSESICHITITAGAAASGGEPSISMMDNNVTQTYTDADNARLILNTPSPIVENISAITTSLDENGTVHVSFKRK